MTNEKSKPTPPPLIVYTAFGVLFAILFHSFKTGLATSPQIVKIGLRQTREVAKGKIFIRLMPDVDKGGTDEIVGPNPTVDVKCYPNLKEEFHNIKLAINSPQTVCGISLQLLKVYKDGLSGDYPYAEIEVTR